MEVDVVGQDENLFDSMLSVPTVLDDFLCERGDDEHHVAIEAGYGVINYDDARRIYPICLQAAVYEVVEVQERDEVVLAFAKSPSGISAIRSDDSVHPLTLLVFGEAEAGEAKAFEQ